MFRREVMRRRGRSAEIERRIRALHRRIEVAGLFHPKMLAGKIDRFAGLQKLPPDRQKLIGGFIALVMWQEHPVGGKLGRVAARHHVQ